MSLLRSTEISDSVTRPYVGRVRFEFYLPLPVAIGVALVGLPVLVGVWVTGTAPSGGAVLPELSVGVVGENSVSSWWNMI